MLTMLSGLSSFAQTDSLSISASFTGFEEGTYLYLWTHLGGIGSISDSAQIKGNQFQIKYKLIESPSVIYIAGKNFNPILRLWAENTAILLSGNKDKFDKSKIHGSPINEVALLLTSHSGERNQLLSLIEEHIDCKPAIQKLYFLAEKISHETLEKLYNQIPENLKEYDYSKRINNLLSHPNLAIPNIGDQFVDFEAYDAKGTHYTFSELNDRYILLEFGSSYCGPCFFAVPELSKLQQEEEDRLRIVSFSLDTREQNWHKGLERIAAREKFAHVLHIWDGEGENGAIPLKYGVSGIPIFYLFNPEGKMIDKWEGYREGEVLKHWKGALSAE